MPGSPREGAIAPASGELCLVGVSQCWPEIQIFNLKSFDSQPSNSDFYNRLYAK